MAARAPGVYAYGFGAGGGVGGADLSCSTGGASSVV